MIADTRAYLHMEKFTEGMQVGFEQFQLNMQ